jgi:hypothetical protein
MATLIADTPVLKKRDSVRLLKNLVKCVNRNLSESERKKLAKEHEIMKRDYELMVSNSEGKNF